MKVEALFDILQADFFAGVPDSQLKPLCDWLMGTYGIDPQHHIIAANEGNCLALAAGYHLATGKVPVVYLQNSGIGNIINPLASLTHPEVYGIPCLFIVGWRGEPGVHDEPQHIYQGKVTARLLEDMEVDTFILGKDTTEEELAARMAQFRLLFAKGKSAAIIVRKGALVGGAPCKYGNAYTMRREEVIRHIALASGNDPIVSTTGKASRELFEIRAARGDAHDHDLLTVGSMGHSSSIALGIALNKPQTRVWCIDGDGALLMHMGAMAVIGACAPGNLIHVVINNSAHETVGGMPTAVGSIDLQGVAKSCGYRDTIRVQTYEELDAALQRVREQEGPVLLEACCTIYARADLGRPTTTPGENITAFKGFLQGLA